MLFLDVSLSYGGFKFDHMIHGGFLLSESALGIGDKVVGFYKPNQLFIYHKLYGFSEAAC